MLGIPYMSVGLNWFKPAHKLFERNADSNAYRTQLKEIESSLTRFVFAYIRLRAMKLVCQVTLAQPCF